MAKLQYNQDVEDMPTLDEMWAKLTGKDGDNYAPTFEEIQEKFAEIFGG